MERLTLAVQSRGKDTKIPEESGKMLRGVVYGSKVDSFSVWFTTIDFQKIFAQAGENTLIDLKMNSGNAYTVLIHDVQYSPMRNTPTHADFFVVNMKENVETSVPLEFIGESDVVKSEGGVLVKNMEEIGVRCLPNDIPKSFTVDLSVLKTFDDCIYVKDIVQSDKYEVLIDGESAIVLVARPRVEEVIETTAPENTVAEVEVEAKEKENSEDKK